MRDDGVTRTECFTDVDLSAVNINDVRYVIADVTKMPAADLHKLIRDACQLQIFGPWVDEAERSCRPEPHHTMASQARVRVWYDDGFASGWNYRLGFGVDEIPGINSTTPFPTREAAKAAVDKRLYSIPKTVVVDPVKTE